MTMPHLMNCQHSDSGWCLACVKELGERAAALQDKLDDWMNAAAGAMDETCGASEKHCTCVPLLRARVKELESKLPITSDGIRVGSGDIVWFVDPPCVLPWRVEGGESARDSWPGVIHAFPEWGESSNPPLHKWPDDIDGLLPSKCFAMKENAEAHLRKMREIKSN